jgi:hypothetical protein
MAKDAFIETFQRLSTAQQGQAYTVTTSGTHAITAGAGRRAGTYGYESTPGAAAHGIKRSVSTIYTGTGYAGFSVKPSTINAVSSTVLDTVLGNFWVGAVGQIAFGYDQFGKFIVGDATTAGAYILFARSQLPVFRAGLWAFVEMRYKFANAGGGGFLDAWVNGAQCVAYTGNMLHAGTAGVDGMSLGGQLASAFGIAAGTSQVTRLRTHGEWYFDPGGLYGARWKDHFGVYALANAAGTTTQFTPLSGTNVSNVDDPIGSHDADATYVESSTVNQLDTYNIDNQIAITGTAIIPCVQPVVSWRTDVTSSRSGALLTKSTGGTATGTAAAVVSTTFVTAHEAYATDPTDSTAWTTAKLNALEIGQKVTA